MTFFYMVSKFYNEQVAKQTKNKSSSFLVFSPSKIGKQLYAFITAFMIAMATCLVSFFSNKQI